MMTCAETFNLLGYTVVNYTKSKIDPDAYCSLVPSEPTSLLGSPARAASPTSLTSCLRCEWRSRNSIPQLAYRLVI